MGGSLGGRLLLKGGRMLEQVGDLLALAGEAEDGFRVEKAGDLRPVAAIRETEAGAT